MKSKRMMQQNQKKKKKMNKIKNFPNGKLWMISSKKNIESNILL